MLASVVIALAVPVSVGWQVLEVRGLTCDPVKLLVVVEDAAQRQGLTGETAARFDVVAAAVQINLREGREPDPALVRDYLAATQGLPKAKVLRTWLALPEGLVTSTFVSDEAAGGVAWGIDDPTGERIGLASWTGPQSAAESRDLLRRLFVATTEKEFSTAEEALIRKAKGRDSCVKLLVKAAGRSELLPCGSTTADMGELLSSLWPEVSSEARERLGKMLVFAAKAPARPDGFAFPYFGFLRSFALPVERLGIAGAALQMVQLEPGSSEFIGWRLPDSAQVRAILGDKPLRPADLTLSFAQRLREIL